MKIIENYHIECLQEEAIACNEHVSDFIRCFDLFTSISTGAFYVLDVHQKQFCHIKSDDLFLCGFSVEEAFKLGYNFYSKIIYAEDLSLWKDIYKSILHYFNNRIEKRNYSFLGLRSLTQMVCRRMKPIWGNNELHYLNCSIESSTVWEAGNLRMHNRDKFIYEEYNFITKRWKRKQLEPLTERERAILMLAQQGKNTKQRILIKGA